MSLQSAFNKCLSQKIRHLHLDIRTKSKRVLEGTPTSSGNKRPHFRVLDTNEPVEPSSSFDIERHREQLDAEYRKKQPAQDRTHLKQLLRETRQHHLELLSDNPNGGIAPIFEKYPCF